MKPTSRSTLSARSRIGDLEIRQLRPVDAPAYLRFFNSLDQETIRCRYGYMVSSLTIDAAVKIASLDPEWEPALAAFSGEDGDIVAIGRFHADARHREAEIAVVVSRSMRRMGLGRLLVSKLIELAGERGLKALHAYVVTEDAPVIDLLQSFGFRIHPDNDSDSASDEEIHLSLALGEHAAAASRRNVARE